MVPMWLLEHSRLAALANGYFQQSIERAELGRPKPAYTIRLPKQLDEHNPDVDSLELPSGLPVFVRDVKQMIAVSRDAGVPFIMSTLPWLDGSEVQQPGEFAHIIGQQDTTFWPLSSPDMRRLITLQNRVLQRLAETQRCWIRRRPTRWIRTSSLICTISIGMASVYRHGSCCNILSRLQHC
jgi:hypothetical protein